MKVGRTDQSAQIAPAETETAGLSITVERNPENARALRALIAKAYARALAAKAEHDQSAKTNAAD